MISIIIPIYNVEHYLKRCLQSILMQTYTDWELILVNDGSLDASLAIAEQFATTNRRIRLFSQSNKGQSAARNVGLQHATGEWICFIDADDWIEPDYLETLVSHSRNADIVQCGYKRIDNTMQVIKEDVPRSRYRLTSMCCRLIKKEVFTLNKLLFPEGLIYEDVLMSVDIWITAPRIQLVQYSGYNYLVNPSSTTSRKHDTRAVFRELHNKARHTTFKGRLIVLYTIVRLRMHFLLGRK